MLGWSSSKWPIWDLALGRLLHEGIEAMRRLPDTQPHACLPQRALHLPTLPAMELQVEITRLTPEPQ